MNKNTKYKIQNAKLSGCSISYKKGFTLIELVVVTALISVVSLILVTFLTQSLKTYRIRNESVKAEENAASAMREFERSARAATKIVTASENEFKFYRFYDLTSPEPVQVRYFIEGGDFKVGMTDPFGLSPNVTYSPSNERIELIISNVTNTNILFNYYDSANSEIPAPVNISAVRMAELTISLDKDPTKPPEEITQITRVNFRNLKDNL